MTYNLPTTYPSRMPFLRFSSNDWWVNGTNASAQAYSGVSNGQIREGYEYSYPFITDQTLTVNVMGTYLRSVSAGSSGFTATGNTHTSTTLDSVTSATTISVGQSITGTGIPSGTIVSAVSGTTPNISITLSQAATSSNNGITITLAVPYVRFGIRADNGSGRPGTLQYDAGWVTTTGSNSHPTVTLGTPQVLYADTLYWISGVAQGLAATPASIAYASSPFYFVPNYNTAQINTSITAGYRQTAVTGALSSSPGILTSFSVSSGEGIWLEMQFA